MVGGGGGGGVEGGGWCEDSTAVPASCGTQLQASPRSVFRRRRKPAWVTRRLSAVGGRRVFHSGRRLPAAGWHIIVSDGDLISDRAVGSNGISSQARSGSEFRTKAYVHGPGSCLIAPPPSGIEKAAAAASISCKYFRTLRY